MCSIWNARAIPYDVIVIGEEHGNDAYHREILRALPELHSLGYRFLALEQPKDLTDGVELYLKGKKTLDEGLSNQALWLIFARMKGLGRPAVVPSRMSPFKEGDRILSALDLLTEASCGGYTVQLVDIPTHKIRSYVHQYKPTGLKGDDEDSFRKMLSGVYGTLGARNRHMAEEVEPKTILIVGRAHTGETEQCVEVFLRGRGFSVLSIDLIGADNSTHGIPSENADVSVALSELRESGGIARVVADMAKSGFSGKNAEKQESIGEVQKHAGQ